MNNSSKPFLFLCLLASLFLSSCGGSSGTNDPAMANITVDWLSGGVSASFASYSSSISAKASVDGGALIEGPYSGGKYSFMFSDIADGDHSLSVEFYYADKKIGSAVVPVTLKGGAVAEIAISSADIKFEGEATNASEAVTDIAANDNVDLDGDGLSDKKEKELGTDPANPDTDSDGVPDGVEVASGLDPLNADTDGDGTSDKLDAFPLDPTETLDTDKDMVGDNTDNCVNAANLDQLDTDGDGIGDACADDDDGDGVSDADEAKYGTDPKNADTDKDGLPDGVEVDNGTDPLLEDSDLDDINDKEDAFPLNKWQSEDADNDGFGDVYDGNGDGIKDGDNCVMAANPDQKNTDLDYQAGNVRRPIDGLYVTGDDLGDACDDDIDNDSLNVIYVRSTAVDDNLGTYEKPVKTIKKAIELAKQRKATAVYLAAGSYKIDDVTFEGGINFKGGFDDGNIDLANTFHVAFYKFQQHQKDNSYKTVLTNAGKSVTLLLKDFSSTFTLDGFYLGSDAADDKVGSDGLIPDTDDYGCTQATVYLDNSGITLSNNVITVSDKATKPCGVLLEGEAAASLNANKIDASGDDDAVSSTAISIVGSAAKITNNVLIAGKGEHGFGVRMTDSGAAIVNNTIDGSSYAEHPKSAYGIAFDGGSPLMINNLIYTSLAPDQSALICSGAEVTDAKVKNNLLTTFPQGGTNAVLIDCEGEFTTTAEFIADPAGLLLDGADVSDNQPFNDPLVSNLLDAKFVPQAATAIDKGTDTRGEEYGKVVSDYNGKARPADGKNYDIGAVEK